MGRFFGSLIGTILSRILVMAAIVMGGQYYLGQSGGIAGLLGGGGSGGASASGASPIAAGIGGIGAIAASLGLGGSAGSDHFEVQGRISAIRTECRLVARIDGRTKRTEPLGCDRARMALAYPQFARYSLDEARIATYLYYAMDGVEVLQGKADARRGQRVGDVIDLRIDRADPRRSTPI